MEFRTERDSLGLIKVPADVYYGAQTQRAIQNFPVSGLRFQPNFIRSYIMIKRSAAVSNMATRRLDGRRGYAIVRACDEILKGKLADQFVVDVYQTGAGTATNMNVNEVVANRAIEILGGHKGKYSIVHPNDHVNMAQSTNDTFHSAMHVATSLYIKSRLLPALRQLQKSLDRKSREFSRIVKSGRTHLRDALPITLGQEFSGYATTVNKGINRIETASQTLLELNLGGTAVGTGLNAEPKYVKQVYRELNRITKLKFRPAKNLFASTQNMNAVLNVHGALKILAVSLVKIASDLRLLSSGPATGLNELILPAVQPGSSIMPGKINPSIPEMVNMVGFQVMGNDVTITMACSSGQLELNVFMPVAAYNLLNSLETLSNACKILDEKCVRGIRANEQKIKEYLDKNPEIVTALVPYIGYEKAEGIAKRAYQTGKSVREIILEMKLFSAKELDKILDFRQLTKPGIPKKNK